MATFTAPPWIAMLQAHADQAEARTRALTETTTSLARDITNAVTDDTVGRTATHRRDGLGLLSMPQEAPMRCNYCGLPTPDGGGLHPICRIEVGPLHSCPDCNTGPCAACDPGEQQ